MSSTTGLNHTATFSYADNYDSNPSSSTNAFLTKITDSLGHISKFKYAYLDSHLIQSQDQNDLNSSGTGFTYTFADALRRLTEIDYPDGGKTTISYNDTPPHPTVTSNRLMNSPNQFVTTTTTMDAIGHAIKSILTPDPDCASGDRVDTTYGGTGRVYTVSNPYCATTDRTYDLTTYSHDALSRTTSVTKQSGSAVVSTSYAGNCTTVTDEAGKSRKSCSDALGRLTTVYEDPAGLNYLTSYTYDALNNLTSVVQSGLGQRTFVYDSLSRLTSATNPESGTVTYAYDANGNLTSKTAPAPNQTGAATVTTTYTYDALNRLTQKSYSDTSPTYANGTPTVLFGYDQSSVLECSGTKFTIANSIGRMSWAAPVDQNTIPITMHSFSYDPVGRITQFWQCPPSTRNVKDQVVVYDYDLIGNPKDFFIAANQAISQGVVQNLTYNGAGRLASFSENGFNDATHPPNLITGITYNALGQKTSATFANGLTQSWLYNKRGFVTNMAAGTGCSAGSCATTKYGYTLTYAPNGNVTSANDTVNGNWNYSYDALNRLVCANLAANGTCPTTGTPTYSYTYDRFGNRLHQTGPITFNATFTGSNNRIDGYCYDSAGNLLDEAPCPTGSNPVHAFKYDAENRLVAASLLGTNYIYDADGRRVEKATGTTLEDYIYDKDGNILSNWITNSPSYAEYNANGWHFMTAYVNAAHTAETEYFQHSDWLGTERMRSDINGNIYETCTSLPFGDGLNCTGTADVSPMHFTGKERDPESGLDNFGARYYGSSIGRFMTADLPDAPVALPFTDYTTPQTTNQYSYLEGNPLLGVDPDGHDPKHGGRCEGLLCFLTSWLFGGSDNDNEEVTVTPLHWGAYSSDSDTASPTTRMMANTHIPGTGLTYGQFYRGADQKMAEAAEVLQSGLEFMDPTGIYMSGAGTAGGLRSGGDFAFAALLGLLDLHHPWPKYLGGAVDQELLPLGRELHQQYHAGLDKIADRFRGKVYFDTLSPADKTALFRRVAAYTKDFDAKHGTHVYQVMLKNGFPLL
jgi:RHS repeat-associated protein